MDRDGNVLVTQRFWSLFDVGLRSALKELHGWTVLLENDANLAALGERWRGSGAGVDDLVVLLAGERLGAGVMESGRLLHGRGGAAGEMGYLDMVEGVGSSDGIAALARQWSAAGGGPSAGGPASAPRVFADAAAGRSRGPGHPGPDFGAHGPGHRLDREPDQPRAGGDRRRRRRVRRRRSCRASQRCSPASPRRPRG